MKCSQEFLYGNVQNSYLFIIPVRSLLDSLEVAPRCHFLTAKCVICNACSSNSCSNSLFTYRGLWKMLKESYSILFYSILLLLIIARLDPHYTAR